MSEKVALSTEDQSIITKLQRFLGLGILTQEEYNKKEQEVLLKYQQKKQEEIKQETQKQNKYGSIQLSKDDQEILNKLQYFLEKGYITAQEFNEKNEKINAKYMTNDSARDAIDKIDKQREEMRKSGFSFSKIDKDALPEGKDLQAKYVFESNKRKELEKDNLKLMESENILRRKLAEVNQEAIFQEAEVKRLKQENEDLKKKLGRANSDLYDERELVKRLRPYKEKFEKLLDETINKGNEGGDDEKEGQEILVNSDGDFIEDTPNSEGNESRNKFKNNSGNGGGEDDNMVSRNIQSNQPRLLSNLDDDDDYNSQNNSGKGKGATVMKSEFVYEESVPVLKSDDEPIVIKVSLNSDSGDYNKRVEQKAPEKSVNDLFAMVDYSKKDDGVIRVQVEDKRKKSWAEMEIEREKRKSQNK